MEDNNFEAITISNQWIMNTIINPMKKLNEYEIMAMNGYSSTLQLANIDLKPMVLKLEGLKFLKTELSSMLNNVYSFIPRDKYQKLNQKIIMCDTNKKLTTSRFKDLRRRKEETLLNQDVFNSILEILREVKRELYDVLAESELLMPKKTTKEKPIE